MPGERFIDLTGQLLRFIKSADNYFFLVTTWEEITSKNHQGSIIKILKA